MLVSSHRAVNDIMQAPKKEMHFFFILVCCIVFNCFWQLIIFDKKQKYCVNGIHLVTDDGLYDQEAFYKVKIVFIHPLWMMLNLAIKNYCVSNKLSRNIWKCHEKPTIKKYNRKKYK